MHVEYEAHLDMCYEIESAGMGIQERHVLANEMEELKKEKLIVLLRLLMKQDQETKLSLDHITNHITNNIG